MFANDWLNFSCNFSLTFVIVLITCVGYRHKNVNVKTPALRTIGNIVTGDDLQTQAVLSATVLPCLLALLSNPKKGLRKEACWTISNITAGSAEQIQAVFDAGLIAPLVTIMRGPDFDIQKEAAWAISNATSSGRDDQLSYLVTQNVLPALCDLFTCHDSKIIAVALEGVENLLRVGKQNQTRARTTTNKFAEVSSFFFLCSHLLLLSVFVNR